jgi:GNAT superfamily N-acetyltransferase/predicted transcriptional regulator
MVLSVTLDTSCAQSFLSTDEEADEALVEVVAAALRGRLSLAVSQEAFAEVGRTRDDDLRERRLARLRAFECVTLPEHRADECTALAGQLHAVIFPKAQAGTRQDEHNWRDCRQMATHKLIGRQVFLTRDGELLKRTAEASTLGIEVMGPRSLRDRLATETQSFGLSSLASVSVRDAQLPNDEADVRAVLAPLAEDYPGFDGWLTKRLHQSSQTRIRLGEFEGRVCAVALSAHKDNRVMKLSAFFVAEEARAAGLGGHLLWSEIRTWVREGLEKVYVTVSSRHVDLLAFFTGMGFLVEGISSRRYQDNTAEIVLAKHLIRRRVEDSNRDAFVGDVASVVFAAPPGTEIASQNWSLQPDCVRPNFRWADSSHAELVAADGEQELRRWSLLDLERIFHPLRLALSGRQALLVPIEQRWADAMVEYAQQQQTLGSDASTKLLLRADNAYYCYPKAKAVAHPGAPILLYVTEPVGAIIGEARIFEAIVDHPEDLMLRFGDLGIYGLANIKGHVMKSGPNQGKALGLRFGLYVPFEQPVARKEMFRALDRKVVPQGLTPIPFEEFELLRRIGGIEW